MAEQQQQQQEQHHQHVLPLNHIHTVCVHLYESVREGVKKWEKKSRDLKAQQQNGIRKKSIILWYIPTIYSCAIRWLSLSIPFCVIESKTARDRKRSYKHELVQKRKKRSSPFFPLLDSDSFVLNFCCCFCFCCCFYCRSFIFALKLFTAFLFKINKDVALKFVELCACVRVYIFGIGCEFMDLCFL